MLRRQLAGAALAAAGLPLLTVLLVTQRPHLNLSDDLLIYLVAVVAVTVVGGFWPAVFAAVAASLLLNWYFTEPLHTFTIAEPKNLLALVLFVTVAVAVSSVVHLAARREADAARSAKETASLLGLAQTVLGGADTPADVLDHLTSTHGGHAELLERVGGRWIKVAASGAADPATAVIRFEVRPDLALEVSGQAIDRDHVAARRVHRAGGRGAGPGAAAHPGGPGGGARRGQPHADRPACRGEPRPADARWRPSRPA